MGSTREEQVMRLLGVCAVVLAMVASGSEVAGQSNPRFHFLQGGLTHGAHFVDSSRGWVVGSGGVIRHTTNGGNTWVEADIVGFDTNEDIRVGLAAVFVRLDAGGNVFGWAVGENGVVLRTDNDLDQSGHTWKDANPGSRVTDSRDAPLPCPQNKALLTDIFMFPDMLEGWVVGYDGALRQTTDGGATWSNPFQPNLDPAGCGEDPHDFYDIHFFENSFPDAPFSHGVIASEYNQIQITADRGEHWATELIANVPFLCPQMPAAQPGGELGEPPNLELWSLAFDDPLSSTSAGWIVGGVVHNNGYLFRTTGWNPTNPLTPDFELGGTWSQSKCYRFLVPSQHLLPGLCGMSTMYAVQAMSGGGPAAVCGGYGSDVLDFRPGIPNFDPCALCSPLNPPVPPPACSPSESTWVQVDTSLDHTAPPAADEPCNARPVFFGSAKVSATKALFVGSFGRMVMYDSAASTASEKGSSIWTRINDAKFIGNSGWTIGQGFLIMRTTDGGVTWFPANQAQLNCTPASLASEGLGIDFSPNGAVGFAVGAGGRMWRSLNAGVNWSELTSPTTNTLNAVTFAWSANGVPEGPCPLATSMYVVGASGFVARSDDSGNNWTPWTVDVGTGAAALYGVSFASPCAGYVVGSNAKVYRTLDGGATWRAMTVVGNTGETFYDVRTWNAGAGAIVVGQNGSVYQLSGSQFVKQTLGTLNITDHLYGVEVLNNGAYVRIAGGKGLVLFRDNGTWAKKRSQATSDLFRANFDSPTHGYVIGRACEVVAYY